MTKPPIISPMLCSDNMYHPHRETPAGNGKNRPYIEPAFQSIGQASEYCRQVNEQTGHTRNEVLMARMRVKGIDEVTPEDDEVITEIIT